MKHVADLGRVLRAMRRSRCLVVEIVDVRLALAFLRLQGCPSPGGPGEDGIAEEIAARLHRFLVCGVRIGCKYGVGLLAVTRADLLLERCLRRTRAGK